MRAEYESTEYELNANTEYIPTDYELIENYSNTLCYFIGSETKFDPSIFLYVKSLNVCLSLQLAIFRRLYRDISMVPQHTARLTKI